MGLASLTRPLSDRGMGGASVVPSEPPPPRASGTSKDLLISILSAGEERKVVANAASPCCQ